VTGVLKSIRAIFIRSARLIEAHHDLEERRTTGAAVLRVAARELPDQIYALQRPKTPAAPIHETNDSRKEYA